LDAGLLVSKTSTPQILTLTTIHLYS